MQATAAQLAQLINARIEGDPEVVVRRPMRIEEAQAGDFAFLDNPRYAHYAYTTQASVLLVHDDFVVEGQVVPTLLRVADVRGSLAQLLEKFSQPAARTAEAADVSAQASVDPAARVGTGTSVGAFAVIEAGAVVGDYCTIYPQVYIGRNVHIGDGTVLHPGVRVYFDCVVGQNCILHANAVIGADGFGFAPQPDQSWKKIPQVGNVVIENEVEIGANTCIDRAALGSTLVRSGAKIDNLVQVAHNVEIGHNVALASQVGIAGSTKIGDNSLLGGQTGVAGHITLAPGTRTQAQSGIGSAVKQPGTALFGSPAIAYGDYVRAYVVFKDLPDLAKRLRAVEKKIEQIDSETAK
jgi:UDP-3-O-[3-hydroxymyristoyl] glucosamine N-acyltransferase